MIYGSVCSGIEAATVAWHPLGWRCAFVSEIEPFPRAVLKHRWPEIPLHGDFTTIQARDYEPIDLLVGGTPCQSFSVAGLRGGLDDERGNLALEYLRLADRLRPRWLVWENVPGVLSSNSGRDFGAILGGMVELGYGFAYRVLDAQFFGVPQRRRRVFVVGHIGDWRRAAAVLFERHSLSGNPPPRREAGQGTALSPSLRARANSSHRADSQAFIPDLSYALNAHGGAHGRQDAESETLVATALRARDLARGVDSDCTDALIAYTLRGKGFDASEDGTGRGTPLVPVSFGISRDALDRSGEGAGGTAGERPGLGILEEQSPTLKAKGPNAVAFNLRGREGGAMPETDDLASMRAASGGSSRSYVAFDCKASGQNGFGVGEIAGTQRSMSHKNSHSNAGGHQAVAIDSAVRRLTPRECERLQGFLDDYTLIPWRKGEAPDGPRYKALGNSMAVPVMAWIGRRIEAVKALTTTSQGVA